MKMNSKGNLIYASICAIGLILVLGFGSDNVLIDIAFIILYNFLALIFMFFLCEKFPNKLYKEKQK